MVINDFLLNLNKWTEDEVGLLLFVPSLETSLSPMLAYFFTIHGNLYFQAKRDSNGTDIY